MTHLYNNITLKCFFLFYFNYTGSSLKAPILAYVIFRGVGNQRTRKKNPPTLDGDQYLIVIHIFSDDYLYWSDGATWLTGQNVFGATGRINRYSINDGTNEELFSLPNSQLMDIMIDGAWLYYLDWKNV